MKIKKRTLSIIILLLITAGLGVVICFGVKAFQTSSSSPPPPSPTPSLRQLVTVSNLTKVAVYSGNFGNYRNELAHGIDSIPFDNKIDYFFFTDNTTRIRSNHWRVIEHPTVPGDDIMDSYRWTSKFIKFNLPNILYKYDVIVWYDNKVVNKPVKSMLSFNDIILKALKHKINFVAHPDRNTTAEEILKTIKLGKENKENGFSFLKEVYHENLRLPLVDTCFIIRVNDRAVNALFESAFKTLKEKGLKRDQNIMSYVVQKQNFPLEDISISLTKPIPLSPKKLKRWF